MYFTTLDMEPYAADSENGFDEENNQLESSPKTGDESEPPSSDSSLNVEEAINEKSPSLVKRSFRGIYFWFSFYSFSLDQCNDIMNDYLAFLLY